MNTQTVPSLEESLSLILGLPNDVPPHVILLLIALRSSTDLVQGYIRVTQERLVHAMHVHRSSVQRALDTAASLSWQFVNVGYTYQSGDRVNIRFEHPNSKDKSLGWLGEFKGNVYSINWNRIREVSDGRVLTENTRSGEKVDERFGDSQRIIGRKEESQKQPHCTGGENQPLTPSADCVAEPTPVPLGVVLCNRMNDLLKDALRRIGIREPKRAVQGTQAERALERFVETLSVRGQWSAYDRAANLFSFWVEDKNLKDLRIPSAVFINEAKNFIPLLEAWEAANPTVQWRDLSPDSLQDARIDEISAVVMDINAVTPDRRAILKTLRLHDYDVAAITKAVRYFFPKAAGGRDAKKSVHDFFEQDGVSGALIRIDHEEKAYAADKKARADAAAADAKKKAEAAAAAAVEQARVTAENSKREKEQAEQRRDEQVRDERAEQAASERRLQTIQQISKALSSDWTFDGADVWTASYGVTVHLDRTADRAEVIGTTGQRRVYSTEDIEKLTYAAVAAD